MRSRWKGMIFDLDGTLLDSMPVHGKAWMETLPRFGLHMDPKRLLILGGTPSTQIVRILAEEQGVEVDPVTVARQKAEAYLRRLSWVRPIEPVLRIVRRWHRRIPLAVATGGQFAVAERVLEATGLASYFQAVVTSDQVPRPKPAPDLYLEAARRIGVAPSDCLGFEDTPTGLQGLQTAGIQAVYVPDFLARWKRLGYRPNPEQLPPPEETIPALSAWA